VLTDEHVIAGLSRYVKRRFKWPATNEREQLALLDRLAVLGFSGWTLFPTGDETAALIAENYTYLSEKFILTTPSWEILRLAYDKRETYNLAANLNLPHPFTLYPRNREELAKLHCRFPMVLKPAIKRDRSKFTLDKAWLVTSEAELLQRYEEASGMIDQSAIMLQQMIPGERDCQFSYGALCINGKVVASIVAERCRQYPTDFGHSSSYVESIEEPEVEMIGRKVLHAIHLSGLVEVEFKRDAVTGELKLLDVNPRVWGWHTLGARAGVDFSYLAWLAANGVPVSEVRACAGVRWIRGTTDMLAAIRMLRDRALSFGTYLHSFHAPLEFAIWASDDPLPAICEIPTLMIAKRRVRSALHARVSRQRFKYRVPESQDVDGESHAAGL